MSQKKHQSEAIIICSSPSPIKVGLQGMLPGALNRSVTCEDSGSARRRARGDTWDSDRHTFPSLSLGTCHVTLRFKAPGSMPSRPTLMGDGEERMIIASL